LNKRSGKIRNKVDRRFLSIVAAVILAAVIALPALASPTTAVRTLPTSVVSGDTFDVTIQTSGCGFAGQVVETLPDGFTYISCTPDDIGVKQVGNTVKFTFLGDSASFTYRVKAPAVDTTTTYTFQGIVKDENKNEYPIEDDDITVTAGAPGPITYILTMAVHGNGSTTPSVGNHVYDARDVVSISATADSGWRFNRWSSNVADLSSSSTTVTMDSGKTVTAYFSPTGEAKPDSPIYTLTVTCKPSEGGSVTLTPTGWRIGVHEPSEEVTRGDYNPDTLVELTAIPNNGYVFGSWSGDLTGSNNPDTVSMDTDKNVTANFVLSASERPIVGGEHARPYFAVSPLSVSPKQVQPNQQVDISINIVNQGEKTGSYEAILYINEQVESSRTLSISPGSSQNVVFSITKATPGTYAVSLGRQQGQFTVVGSQSASGGLGVGGIVAIVVIVALIAALVLVFRRIKKGA